MSTDEKGPSDEDLEERLDHQPSNGRFLQKGTQEETEQKYSPGLIDLLAQFVRSQGFHDPKEYTSLDPDARQELDQNFIEFMLERAGPKQLRELVRGYWELHKDVDAERFLDRLVELEPSELSYYQMLNFLVRTDDSLELGRESPKRSKFARYLTEFCRCDSDKIKHLTNIGIFSAALGFPEAIPLLSNAVALNAQKKEGKIILPALVMTNYLSKLETSAGSKEEYKRIMSDFEDNGLCIDPARYAAEVIRVMKGDEERFPKITVGNPLNTVVYIKEAGLNYIAFGRPENLPLPPMIIKKQKKGEEFFEGAMLEVMRLKIADRGQQENFQVPRSVLSSPVDGEMYLFLETVSGISLQEKIESYHQSNDPLLAEALLNDFRATMKFLALAHVVGTHETNDWLAHVSGRFAIKQKGYSPLRRLHKRLGELHLTDEDAKKEAIAMITENYTPICEALDMSPLVFDKDAHANQWIVSAPEAERDAPVFGIDWEYRGLIPLVIDYANLFDNFPGNPLNLQQRSYLMAWNMLSYNIEYLLFNHLGLVKPSYEEMMGFAYEPLLRFEQEGKRYGSREQLSQLTSEVLNRTVGLAQSFPEADLIKEPAKILFSYPKAVVHRCLEVAGTVEEKEFLNRKHHRLPLLEKARWALASAQNWPQADLEYEDEYRRIGEGIDLLIKYLVR